MNIDDGRLLQEDLDRITLWCQDWRMDLNQSKCTVMSITGNVSPVISSYILQNTPVQRTDAQKRSWDLSVQGLEMELTCASSCFHREPTQSVCVADCYLIVNVLDLPFERVPN